MALALVASQLNASRRPSLKWAPTEATLTWGVGAAHERSPHGEATFTELPITKVALMKVTLPKTALEVT